MTRISCGLGCVALLLLGACNQTGPGQQASADQLAPHPLAGVPAAPSSAPPKLSPPAAPPAQQPVSAPPPQADAQADVAGANAEDQVPDIPPEALAEMEEQGVAEVTQQLTQRPHLATDFAYVGFDGKPGKLSAQFGQPLVVNFWAVWCGWCVKEMPDLQAVYSEKQGKFQMLGVCSDQQLDPPGFIKRHGYTWNFVYDTPDHAGSKAYKIEGIPRTLFINRKGQIVVDFVGAMPKKAFELALTKIL